MKRLVTLVLSVLATTSALAAPPSRESVEQLLAVTNPEKMLGNVRQSIEIAIRSAVTQNTQGKTLNANGQRVMERYVAEANAIVKEQIAWDKLKPAYVQIYTEAFTQEEVNGLIAFYRTPVGQATIEKMPKVMQKTFAVNQQQIAPMVQRIHANLNLALKEAQVTK